MSTNTKIEWTEATWNPIRGCSMAPGSETGGCLNCYAARQAIRHASPGGAYEGLARMTDSGPRWTGKILPVIDNWEEPLHWKSPRRVFVNSMSDLFHGNVKGEWIEQIFATMELAVALHGHTFQILTKRPENARRFFTETAFGRGYAKGIATGAEGYRHIWLGVSVENQATADARIPELLKTPAAVRWVSYEPALGSVDFGGHFLDNRAGTWPGIDWVVCGGESGPGARPMDLDWAYSVKAQCKAAGVPFFMKQLGAVPMERDEDWRGRVVTRLLSAKNRFRVPEGFVPLKFQDKKGGDISEWPEDLRVREYPQ